MNFAVATPSQLWATAAEIPIPVYTLNYVNESKPLDPIKWLAKK